jgi:hypothetical protein
MANDAIAGYIASLKKPQRADSEREETLVTIA